MRNVRLHAHLVGCVSALTLLAPSVAFAQDTPQQNDSLQLEEIVVTAQRRSENVQDVPIAISAVTALQLEAAGVDKLDSLNILSPSVNIRQSAGNLTPYLRGIGTSASGVENPVALYVDGVYISTQREVGVDLIDIEQISVLKGPQGTLFGRNATAGVIQVATRNPSYESYGEALLSYDNYDTLKAASYLTTGLTDRIAASLTVQYVDQGKGWGRNSTTGEELFYIDHALNLRGKLLFEFGESDSLILSGDYQDKSEVGFVALRPFPDVAGFRPRYPYVERGDRYDIQANDPAYRDLESGGVSATLNNDLGFAKLVNISAYRKIANYYAFDADASPLPLLNITNEDNHKTFSHEIQLVSPDEDKFKWILGGYYFYNKLATEPNSLHFGGALAPTPTATRRRDLFSYQKVESFAAFGQATYEILPDTNLTGGIRYTTETRDFHVEEAITLNNGTYTPNTLTPALTDRKLDVERPTWRVAVDHKFSPDIMGYVSYNRGFKSGGYNMTNARNDAFLPEVLDAYETGLKMDLLDRALRLNIGAFMYDYKNIQVVAYTPVSFIQNGALAKLQGLEADFEAQISSAFSLSGGIAYLDSEFKKFPNSGCSTNLPTGGATITPCDVSGNRLPYASKFQSSLTGTYKADFDAGRLTLSTTALYNGGYYFEAENYLKQDAYWQLSSAVTWNPAGTDIDISVFGRNLTDEAIAVFAPSQGSASIGHQVVYGAPRTYGVSVKAKF